MAEELPKVYEGDRPYIFVSYTHADRLAALPIIAALVAEGYRVWYDDGIELAEDYPEYIANHVYGCSCFVMLISSSALSSKWCKKEADYAIDLDKSFLPIYLQDVELPRGLQMGMGRRQAMFWYEFDSNEAFYRKLFKARRLEPCLTPEGKERRGVKARGGGTKVSATQATGQVPEEPRADVRRNGLAGAVDSQSAGRREPSSGNAKSEGAGIRDGQAATAAPKASDSQTFDSVADQPGADKSKGTQPRDGRRTNGATQDDERGRAKHEAKVGTLSGGSRHMDVAGGKSKGDERTSTREHFVDGKADVAAGAHEAEETGGARSAVSSDKGERLGSSSTGLVLPGAADNRSRSRILSVAPKKPLSVYSWAELKEISRLIAAAGSDVTALTIAKRYNLVDKDGKLRGETKAITLKDDTETSVRILGFRHDGLAGGGRAGISFEFADVPKRHRMNPGWTNEGGWERSEMRRWLNDGRAGFLSLLPDDLRRHVAPAAKRTNNRGRVPEGDTASVTGTTDTLWLPSVSEVYGRLSDQMVNVPWSPATYDAEGTQYKLYVDKGVSTSSYGPCKKRGKDGADSWWWLRSPLAGGAYGFLCVYRYGGWVCGYASDGWGGSPGFCF